MRMEQLIEQEDLWGLDVWLRNHNNPDYEDQFKPTSCWKTGQEGKHTWLTYAVSEGLWELVAILLFHGADPLQTCPRNRNYTAFNYLVKWRPYRDYGLYYFGATLLNKEGRAAEYLGLMFPQDHVQPFGADVNALMPDMDPVTAHFLLSGTHIKTALMHAADNVYPFCTRWLIRGRRARVNLCLDNSKNAMYFAMKRFPGCMATDSHSPDYMMKLWMYWWLLVDELMRFNANPSRWRKKFPEAWTFIRAYVETVHMTPQHELPKILEYPCNMHFV